jgi:hypothetical protein
MLDFGLMMIEIISQQMPLMSAEKFLCGHLRNQREQ